MRNRMNGVLMNTSHNVNLATNAQVHAHVKGPQHRDQIIDVVESGQGWRKRNADEIALIAADRPEADPARRTIVITRTSIR